MGRTGWIPDDSIYKFHVFYRSDVGRMGIEHEIRLF